jgi:hypothetical protein
MIANLFASREARSAIRDDWTVYNALHSTWNAHGLWKTAGGHKQFSASEIARKVVNVVRDARNNEGVPPTMRDFYSFIENHTSQYDWEELFMQALLLVFQAKRASGIEVTTETAYAFALKKVVDETVEGFLREREGKAVLEEQFPETQWRFSSPLEDRQDGVDVIGLDPSGFVTGVQIKPVSYVNGYRTNQKIFANRCKEHKHHERFTRKHKRACVQIWYIDPADGWLYLKAENMPCVACGFNPKTLSD